MTDYPYPNGHPGAGGCAACDQPVPAPQAVRTADGRVWHYEHRPHCATAAAITRRITERPDGYWTPSAAARLTRPGETLAVTEHEPPVWLAHSEPAGAADCAKRPLRPDWNHPIAGGYDPDTGGLVPCPQCVAFVLRPGATAALRR